MSEERELITRIIHQYTSAGMATDPQVNVTLLPDHKTSFVEPTQDGGRGLSLDEFRIDGRIIWAAYSTRTRTVYLSNAPGRPG